MFVCPECGRSFPAGGFCTEDGQNLRDVGDDSLLGTAVGSYRVAKKLGQGGMGTVYLGVHHSIGSRVAIKVLSQECAKSRALVDRFFAEARAVNVIRHESIVSVTDLASLPDGRPYIVMEYLDGGSLADLLKAHGALPLGTLTRLLREMLGALDAAHKKGIIHRDLKPDNVYVTTSGRVKVLDFGIAKLRPDISGIDEATRTGSLMGTPYYMSPEQATGQPVDPRSDLYSVGVMLFEGVTGQRPFVVSNLYELLKAHVEWMPPAPSSLRPDVPPALEQILLRALQKEPVHRFQSAHELASALEHAELQLPPESFVAPGVLLDAAARGAVVQPSSPSAASPMGSSPSAAGYRAEASFSSLSAPAGTPASFGHSAAYAPPEKPKSRFGYFAVGTCGVIVLATLGSCVTCVALTDTKEKEISVPLGDGEVAVYAPKKFDPAGFAPRAASVAMKKDESARLVEIRAGGEWSSNGVDLTKQSTDRVVYVYGTASGCTEVDVADTGLSSRKSEGCSKTTLRSPQCSADKLWSKLLQAGGPISGARCVVSYAAVDDAPTWKAQCDTWTATVKDDC